MPKRRTVAQILASKRNLERARQAKLYGKAKLAFNRYSALEILHTEGRLPKHLRSVSIEKAYNKWQTYYFMSRVKPVGKSKRHLSHRRAMKALEGHKVQARLFGA